MKLTQHRARRAFTMVELLVVIGILGILMSIAIVVAGHVTQSGKARLTESTIRVLDTILTTYLSERETKVPAIYTDGMNARFPLVDGRAVGAGVDRVTDPAEPSLTLFLLIAEELASNKEAIAGLDSKLVSFVPFTTAWGTPMMANGDPVKGFVVKDGFGNPIRFVHPQLDGGGGDYWNARAMIARPPLWVDINGNGLQTANEQFRRSYRFFDGLTPPSTDAVGDADEGICPANRPYFYSGGLDGDPGTRSDNIYTTRPTFPFETAKLE